MTDRPKELTPQQIAAVLNEASEMIAGLIVQERDLRAAIKMALDDIRWMSGSADFSPGGQAYMGWRQVRHRMQYYAKLVGEHVEPDSGHRIVRQSRP